MRTIRRVAGVLVGLVLVVLLAAVLGSSLGSSGSPAATGGETGGAGDGSPGASVGVGSGGTAGLPGADTPEPSTVEPATPPPGPSPTLAPRVPATVLQAHLDSLQRKYAIPGVSVAILWDDGRTWLGAAGLSDVAAKTPVTPDSGFAFASVSKTFTAAVVLQLVDEGRLSLDEPVASLLPAYRLDGRITVRMLLDHTSGLPDFFLNPAIDTALQGTPDATWTPARSWSYVRSKRPVPGTVWTYSNSNYLLLGELVTAVTGRTLATEVRQRLLDPLGLSATWYQVAEAPRAPLTVGYRLVGTSGGGLRPVRVAPASLVMPFRSVVTAAGGAGSIAGTALDAARWMRAFAGGDVLSPRMQAAMLADVATTSVLKAAIPYGLGIEATTLSGRRALGHSGRYLGFRNVVRYLPAAGVTIAVFTNQSAADPARIASSLLSVILLPVPPAAPVAPGRLPG